MNVMNFLIYAASAIAVLSTAMVITRLNAVHALLYLIVSLLAASVVFYLLGAPYVAALEVIVYAGAIMVLFIFTAMMLNLGGDAAREERRMLRPGMWAGPGLLSLALLAELAYFTFSPARPVPAQVVAPKAVGAALFGPYLLAVELAAMLLLAGIVGAYHLGKHRKKSHHRFLNGENR